MHPRTPFAAAADTVVVVAFVAIGRRNHDEGEALAGVAETAAPFLIALAGAWLLYKVSGDRVWDRPTDVATGLAVWPFTVVVGMLLRRFVFNEGTAPSFVVVATVFLGVFLVGWRAVAGVLAGRTRNAASH